MIRKQHDVNKGGSLQLGFFNPSSDWKPPELSSLPSWANAKRVSIDCETKDPDLKELGPGVRREGSHTVGWSFKIEGHKAFYLPTRHEGGGNLPVDQVHAYLAEQAKHFTGEYVGANLSYDVDYANFDGIHFNPKAKFRDVCIADPLINELHRSYSLLNIGKRLGIESKNEEVLRQACESMGLDPKRGLWRLNSKYVGAYAETDADSPLEIYAKQRELIDKFNLQQIFNLETDLLPVLVRMRQRGVALDFDRLDHIDRQIQIQGNQHLAFVKRETGFDIQLADVWKAAALAPAIESLGIRINKTATGKPQIDADMLDNLDNPVATAIAHARKLSRLGTFSSSMRRHQVDGRIHCSFHQIIAQSRDGKDQRGVRYGRLSATDPNLQQMYNPERIGEDDVQLILEWRKIFIPEHGSIWGCNDYSQQEPRWTTHFAAMMKLPKAEEAARRYRDNPKTDNHDMMTRLIHGDEQVDEWLKTDKKLYKSNRSYAKQIFLGECYGEGDAALCGDLGLPTRWALVTGYGRNRSKECFETRHEAWKRKAEVGAGYIREVAGVEGQAIIDGFDREVPYVKQIARKASERADNQGFITTVLGRRLHFAVRDDGTFDWTHKALNRVIQGSSADQTKKAVIDLDKAGFFIQLQVHDETDGSFESPEKAKEAGEIMKNSILEVYEPLVPFNVDTEIGPSWGELKEMK